MNVHLIKTPEYNSNDFQTVYEFLSTFEGPLKFIASEHEFSQSDIELYRSYNTEIFDIERKLKSPREIPNALTWGQYFSLCNLYRNKNYILHNDFVFILTERKNDLNWFSAFDAENNAFIQTSDWNLFTSNNPKYPIAYEVVANVLRTLMREKYNPPYNVFGVQYCLDIIRTPPNLSHFFFHKNARGCINDLCEKKTEIILKLQTANICPQCIEVLNNNKVDNRILIQAKNIFSGIRNEFIFKTELPVLDPVPLIVDNSKKIFFPDQNIEIRLSPLFKTLYLFFLSKPEGVTLSQLSQFKNDLLLIYKKIRPSASEEESERRINNLCHPFGDGFNPAKTRINNTISALLREPLADFYKITGERGEPYKIKVPRKLVEIRL